MTNLAPGRFYYFALSLHNAVVSTVQCYPWFSTVLWPPQCFVFYSALVYTEFLYSPWSLLFTFLTLHVPYSPWSSVFYDEFLSTVIVFHGEWFSKIHFFPLYLDLISSTQFTSTLSHNKQQTDSQFRFELH